MERNWDIVIAGGGAAGLAAAAGALQVNPRGRVLVLEQEQKPGRKLLATGNGRCNLYNTGLNAGAFVAQDRAALETMIDTVRSADVLGFWHGLGLLTEQAKEGRVYPATQQAATVTELLTAVLRYGGAEVRCGARIAAVSRTRNGFRIRTEAGELIAASKLILATGGRATPALGATGTGYGLAQSLGHHCTALHPGLTPIRCVNPPKTLKGLRNVCAVTVWDGAQAVGTWSGEVQFTEYGVSGIVMMQISNVLRPDGQEELELDFLPDRSEEELGHLLREKARRYPDYRADFLLLGVVKKPLAELFLRASRVDGKKRTLRSLTEEEFDLLTLRVKHWRMRTEGRMPYEYAQVTCGGIALSEVDPRTFESICCPGLYLTGELLDAAGDCGGYNLGWAFGSGLAAGRNAGAMLSGGVAFGAPPRTPQAAALGFHPKPRKPFEKGLAKTF